MTFLQYCGIAALIVLSYVLVLVTAFLLLVLLVSVGFVQSEPHSAPTRRGQQAVSKEMIIARPSGHERLKVSRWL